MQIDWSTFALQAVNVLILLWLLKRFLFAPVAAIVARRQAEANRMLDSAQAAEQQAGQARAKLAEQQAALVAESAALRAAARTEAERLRDDILAAAQEEARQIREAQKRDIERELAAVEKDLLQRASRLATGMAGRMLARLPVGGLTESLAAALIGQVAALLPEQRQALVADCATGQMPEMITAHPLPERVMAELSAQLRSVLEVDVRPVWSVDPDLLGGIELHSRHITLRHSWRAQLEQLEAELVRP
jgi:F-type H+-transporting ATPase subunit b